ncbi:MAG TPA: hypothetical protein VGA67_04635 [Candidatus Dojkabacteria bacterium]|jgi:hypothetical protein
MIQKLSDYFKVSERDLKDRGVFNSFIGIDAKIFLDPLLFDDIDIPEFKDSRKKIIKYYENIHRLLKVSKKEKDVAWKEAYKRLRVKEIKGVSIGFGNHSDDGNAVGPVLAERITNRAKEIIDMGFDDPEIFELIGLFEEDFGADRLSDVTVRIIIEDLLSFSQRVADELKIKSRIKVTLPDETTYSVPLNKEYEKPIILLPEATLRSLPIAQSWDDIRFAAYLNHTLRNRLNKFIGETWKKGTKGAKEKLRVLAYENPEVIDAILKGYQESEGKGYDFEKDPEGKVKWLEIGQEFAESNPVEIEKPKTYSLEEMYDVIDAIIKKYSKLIEFNGLNKFLYGKKKGKLKPRHEQFSQLLFFAVADSYCESNDIDLSREPNAGSGSVDFKFSRGYKKKVVVEIKLTSNSNLFKGYNNQVLIYEKAENTNESVYLVIQVTQVSKQLEDLNELYREKLEKGLRCPKLYSVDARIKKSASKRDDFPSFDLPDIEFPDIEL